MDSTLMGPFKSSAMADVEMQAKVEFHNRYMLSVNKHVKINHSVEAFVCEENVLKGSIKREEYGPGHRKRTSLGFLFFFGMALVCVNYDIISVG